MFAGTLLLAGSAASLSAWATYTAVLEHNRRLQEGLNVAHTAVEQLLALPAGHARLKGFDADVDAFSQTAPSTGSTYHVRVAATGDTPTNGFVRLDVIVSWREMAGARTVALVVYRSD